jgi:glutathione S-transferase
MLAATTTWSEYDGWGIVMKLYGMPGSCSFSVHIALRQANVPFELLMVDYETRTAPDGTPFADINWKGYVPALVLDNGEVLTEGIALLDYVADLNPDAQLAPARGTLDRFRVSEWLAFLTTEIHKPYSVLFYPSASQDLKDYGHATLEKRFDWISQSLGDKSYLHGDNFTIADAYLFTLLGWSAFSSFSVDRWTNFGEYRKRIAALPHVAAAMAVEGLSL